MSFNTHYRCDQCESILHVEDESELYEERWLVLSFGEGEDAYHFCSLPCCAHWTVSESSVAIVEAATQHRDEE